MLRIGASDARHVVDLPSLDIGLTSAVEAGIDPECIITLQPLDVLREWIAGLRTQTRSPATAKGRPYNPGPAPFV